MTSMATPNKVLIDCPLCGGTSYSVLYVPSRNVTDPIQLYGAASGVPGTQTLVVCADCRLIYENPRFPEAVILEGYGAAVDAGHDSQYTMRVESFHRALSSLSNFLPPRGAKVLDVGTAGGAFLEAAGRYGFDAVGLEPSHFLAEHGRARGLKIERGTLEKAPFPAASFDLVCFWDVLEHVTAPRQSLERARELLKPGGLVLINYPDIGTWPARLAGSRFWWILSVHLVHFDRRTIRRLAEETGFQSVHLQRYWQTLQLGYLIEVGAIYIPRLGRLLARLTPDFMKRMNISYWASQTTYLARKTA